MFSMVKLQFEHWKNGTKYYSHSGVISSSQKSRMKRLLGRAISLDSIGFTG
ncbi:hypothetical protein VCCP103710_0963 [Vibrio cholerae CP1037(10)]|nr:hypothetical protein VCCP103710_0963 [Vibrio cholerae CP1037(10)]